MMPPELLQQLPALIAIMFVASAIQGATGIGFGLFAVAMLSLFVQLKTATPLMALLNAPVIFFLLWKLRRHVVWQGMGPLWLGMLVGIPFGVFVLVHWPQHVLMRILGVILLGAAWRALKGNNEDGRSGLPGSPSLQVPLGLLVGFSSGALGGAFNTGGPPVIAWIYTRPWTKEQRSATLQALFSVSIVYRVIVMSCAGLYSPPLLLTAAACLPGTLLGGPIGYMLFRRIPPRGLEVFVACFLAALGVKFVVWG